MANEKTEQIVPSQSSPPSPPVLPSSEANNPAAASVTAALDETAAVTAGSVSAPVTVPSRKGLIFAIVAIVLVVSAVGGYFGYNWANGVGNLTLADGGEYFGPYKWRQPDGKGVVTFPDGRRYEGVFHGGQVSGSLVLTSKEGRYEGEFVNGQLEGEGKFRAADNSRTYTGSFKAGKYHGRGVLRLSSGSVYTGEFADGLFDGKGEYLDANGTKTAGQYKAGQPYKVTRIPKDARSYYEETFEGGKLIESKKVPGLLASDIKIRYLGQYGYAPWGDRFPWSAVRYIDFEVTLRNTMNSQQTGQLGVKFLEPDGTLSLGRDSAKGLSFSLNVDVQGQKTVTGNWGNSYYPTFKRGKWTIQFIWDDEPIGEFSFTIY